MEAFLAAGGEKKAKKRKGDSDDKGARKKKMKKDPDAPKKPAGGAFGCYLAKHRAELMEQVKGKPITALTKLASENWKQLSLVEKKPYETAYKAKMEAYKAAKEDYVPPEPTLDEPKVDKRAAAKQAKEEAKQAKMQAKEDAKEEAKLAK